MEKSIFEKNIDFPRDLYDKTHIEFITKSGRTYEVNNDSEIRVEGDAVSFYTIERGLTVSRCVRLDTIESFSCCDYDF